MAPLRSLIVPLIAAFSAALFAHIGIDVAGDYLLPHDAYDDVAHASRALVLGIVATLLALLASGALWAAAREACGSIDAFGRSVRSLLDVSFGATLGATLVCATLTLVAMECADVRAAGHAIDDLGDLFGGSFLLGATIVAFAACGSAVGVRALVRAVAGAGRVLVHAIVSAFATRIAPLALTRHARERATRSFARTRAFGTSISGRAPPPRRIVRPI